MKKILTCLIGAIILSNVQLSCKSANAGDGNEYHLMSLGGNSETVYSYHSFDNMNYVIIGTYYGGNAVINLTKDALEVEMLKKQLSK